MAFFDTFDCNTLRNYISGQLERNFPPQTVVDNLAIQLKIKQNPEDKSLLECASSCIMEEYETYYEALSSLGVSIDTLLVPLSTLDLTNIKFSYPQSAKTSIIDCLGDCCPTTTPSQSNAQAAALAGAAASTQNAIIEAEETSENFLESVLEWLEYAISEAAQRLAIMIASFTLAIALCTLLLGLMTASSAAENATSAPILAAGLAAYSCGAMYPITSDTNPNTTGPAEPGPHIHNMNHVHNVPGVPCLALAVHDLSIATNALEIATNSHTLGQIMYRILNIAAIAAALAVSVAAFSVIFGDLEDKVDRAEASVNDAIAAAAAGLGSQLDAIQEEIEKIEQIQDKLVTVTQPMSTLPIQNAGLSAIPTTLSALSANMENIALQELFELATFQSTQTISLPPGIDITGTLGQAISQADSLLQSQMASVNSLRIPPGTNRNTNQNLRRCRKDEQ